MHAELEILQIIQGGRCPCRRDVGRLLGKRGVRKGIGLADLICTSSTSHLAHLTTMLPFQEDCLTVSVVILGELYFDILNHRCLQGQAGVAGLQTEVCMCYSRQFTFRNSSRGKDAKESSCVPVYSPTKMPMAILRNNANHRAGHYIYITWGKVGVKSLLISRIPRRCAPAPP